MNHLTGNIDRMQTGRDWTEIDRKNIQAARLANAVARMMAACGQSALALQKLKAGPHRVMTVQHVTVLGASPCVNSTGRRAQTNGQGERPVPECLFPLGLLIVVALFDFYFVPISTRREPDNGNGEHKGCKTMEQKLAHSVASFLIVPSAFNTRAGSAVPLAPQPLAGGAVDELNPTPRVKIVRLRIVADEVQLGKVCRPWIAPPPRERSATKRLAQVAQPSGALKRLEKRIERENAQSVPWPDK